MLFAQALIAVQLGLDPVINDPALAVEAQILRHRPVGQLTDVLAGNAMQPGAPFATGECEYCPMRTVNQHCLVDSSSLFAERVAIVPYRADIGPSIRCRHSRHASTLLLYSSRERSSVALRCFPMARQPAVVVTL